MKFNLRSIGRSIFFAGALAISAIPSVWAGTYSLDFEGAVTGTNAIAKGTVPAGSTESSWSCTHSIAVGTFGNVTLTSDWANWGALYPGSYANPTWSWNGGFALSNVNAEDASNSRTSGGKANFAYAYDTYSGTTNTYAAVAGASGYPTDGFDLTVSGAGGSSTYAVLLGSSARGTVGGTISFAHPVALQSLAYANTAGALMIGTYGSSFSQKASDGNWAGVVMRGWDAAGRLVGQKVLMLYDYLGAGSGMVTDWATAALTGDLALNHYAVEYYGDQATFDSINSSLQTASQTSDFDSVKELQSIADFGTFADVSSLTFSFDGSDAGQWGLNFPTYFALDDLVFTYGSDPPVPPTPGVTGLPEPSAFWLLLLAVPLGLRRSRKH